MALRKNDAITTTFQTPQPQTNKTKLERKIRNKPLLQNNRTSSIHTDPFFGRLYWISRLSWPINDDEHKKRGKKNKNKKKEKKKKKVLRW
jgi:hypothetical protein